MSSCKNNGVHLLNSLALPPLMVLKWFQIGCNHTATPTVCAFAFHHFLRVPVGDAFLRGTNPRRPEFDTSCPELHLRIIYIIYVVYSHLTRLVHL